jgi:Ca2+/H+ antiporter
MASRSSTADDIGHRVEHAGERMTGSHDETKWALLTTEFWAMIVLIVAVLIAAAVSDSLDDVRAWTLVTIIGTGYVVSRGIAKAGAEHWSSIRRDRR